MFDENNLRWDEGPPTKQPLESHIIVGNLKIQLKRVMKEFKLRNGKFPPLKVILLGASNFQIFILFFIFLKNLTNPPFFIDGKNSKVNRCHPYEVDEKKNFILF
jgi:hypothetical protein